MAYSITVFDNMDKDIGCLYTKYIPNKNLLDIFTCAKINIRIIQDLYI